jgi:imidazolonepropionase
MDEWMGISDWNNTNIIDAEGGMVFPSYCDSHTHLVFNGSREEEFNDRIKGLTYQEIADNGGGILNSAKKINEISEDELFEISLERLNKLIQLGTGAIEIKSGYGLSIDNEIKILNVIDRLKKISPATIKSTFLGLHAIPKQFKGEKNKYIDLVIDKILPLIEKNNLADFIDVFCEEGYFDTKDTDKILKAGKKIGLVGKTHVNQFNSIGGIKVSIENEALSVDHLETMTEEDFDDLIGTNCMPTLLPSCSFFLGIPYAPANEFIKIGLPIALASDFNPGSSPSGNMNLVSALACIKLKLTSEQVINATTINSAYAMDLDKELGSIMVGKKANLFITKPIPTYKYLHYSFGENLIKKVILNGKIIK